MGLLTGSAPLASTGNKYAGLLGNTQYHMNLAPLAFTPNPNSFRDVPSLNKALQTKQINQNQWMAQFNNITKNNVHPKQYSIGNTAGALGGALNKVIARPTVSATKAVVRPVADVATGNGGKAVHDTAQLARDVGTPATYFLNAAIVNPAKELAASTTHNKVASQNAVRQSRENLGLGDNGKNIKHGLLKLGVESTLAGLGASSPGIAIKGAQKGVDAAKVVTKSDAGVKDLIGNTKAQNLVQALDRAHNGAIANISKKQSLGETGAVTLPKTNDYVKEQVALQEKARKAGSPQGFAKLGATKSEAKTKLIDSFAPIEDTLNKSGAKVAPEKNIKYQIDRALRADTIGSQYIKDKGLAKIIQTVPNTKEFDQYLIAKHAPDLEKNGIKTGRNLLADKQLVKDLGPKYEAHAKAVNEYSQNLLDKATEYGLISKELATHLKQKYPNYIPANRIFGEGELNSLPKGTGGGKASIGTQTIVQKIKGSSRQIESPLSSLIDKSVDVVKQGERNKAAQILTGYKDLPGNPFQLRELKDTETVGEKPVISVFNSGKVQRFETTPEIAAAAKSLNKQQLGLIGKILSAPTRVLRLGATGLNPAFALANVSKDTVSAFINSSHPLRASVANPKVFLQALKASTAHGSKEYGELVREGAGGTSFDIARNAPKQNVRTIRMQKNLPSKILYTTTNPAQLLRAAENTIGRSEEFNRAIQYFGNKQAGIKKGLTAEQARLTAADAARNNTVNFARAGDYGRVINSALPYLNAGVQGSRTLLRNLKDRPVQTTAKLAVTAFFPTAVITAWNTSDPKRRAAYDDIKDYEKQGNLIIVPPHPVKDAKTGKWNVIKIPVSQEIANLNNIVRQGVEAGVKDKSINPASILGNTVAAGTSLNTQSPRQLAGQLTPQAIKPGIESLTNQNLFTGNKIVPDSQKNLAPRDQIGTGTSKTATKLGNALNLSPRQIDNAISTSTGGLGTSIVKGRSLNEQVGGRFKGAQGQSAYDKADTKFSALSKQLQKTSQYQKMQPTEKAKALNRLQRDVTTAYVPQKASNGSTKTPTDRQRAILNGKPQIESYLVAQLNKTSKSSKSSKSSGRPTGH